MGYSAAKLKRATIMGVLINYRDEKQRGDEEEDGQEAEGPDEGKAPVLHFCAVVFSQIISPLHRPLRGGGGRKGLHTSNQCHQK